MKKNKYLHFQCLLLMFMAGCSGKEKSEMPVRQDGSAPEMVATIKQEAEKCAKALLTGDYETLADYTHKRVVAGLGGKKEMAATVKASMSEWQKNGIAIVAATVGQPQEPRKIGSWLVTLVPQHIVMKVPAGRAHQDSHLMGISEDAGKTWVFVDVGPISQEQLVEVFPELDGKITLPPKKKPEIRKEEEPKEAAADDVFKPAL